MRVLARSACARVQRVGAGCRRRCRWWVPPPRASLRRFVGRSGSLAGQAARRLRDARDGAVHQDRGARRHLGLPAQGARADGPPGHRDPAAVLRRLVPARRVRGLGARARGRGARAAPASTGPGPRPGSTWSSWSTRSSTAGHVLYGEYDDNRLRFAFLARAALEYFRSRGERPDVFHAHDWQTGLVPVYLKALLLGRPHAAPHAERLHDPQRGLPGPVRHGHRRPARPARGTWAPPSRSSTTARSAT